MAYLEKAKKNRRWRGVVKKNGEKYTKAFETKSQARQWEAQLKEELMHPQQMETRIGMDFVTACEKYLDDCKLRFSHDTYVEKKTLCKRILAEWGIIDIKDITPAMVSKYLQKRAIETSKNAFNRDRKNLLAMFNWFQKTYGIINQAVTRVERLPEERQPDYIPPSEDIDRVMMAASGQDRVMLKCYYYTFARRSELFDWTWDDINFDKEWYRLWTKKRLHGDKQADQFPMPKESELYQVLSWQWEHREKHSVYVFNNPETGKKYTQRRRFLKGLCEKAGVRPFGFKAFRKYGPSVLNDVHKVSMKKIQMLLRHKAQSTTEIYLKRIDNDLASTVRLLEGKGHTRDTQKDTQSAKEPATIG